MKQYEKEINSILENSDITTITAKTIRNQLESSLGIKFVEKAEKKELNAFITELYLKFQEASTGQGNQLDENVKKEDAEIKKETTPVKATTKVKKEAVKKEATPVEEEAAKKEKKLKKQPVEDKEKQEEDEMEAEEDEMDQDDVLSVDDNVAITRNRKKGKNTPAKKPRKKAAPRPCQVGPELAAIVGAETLMKNEVTKKVWEYIKAKDLQDPADKKYILCDELLLKLTGGETRLYMFHLSRHLIPQITLLPKEKVVKDTKKKGTAGSASKAFNKKHLLSPALSSVLGGIQYEARPQVVKQLWAYIKANELQDPTNKRVILNDEKMLAVFKKKKMSMFEMNKLLTDHLSDASDAIGLDDAVDDDEEEEVNEEEVDEEEVDEEEVDEDSEMVKDEEEVDEEEVDEDSEMVKDEEATAVKVGSPAKVSSPFKVSSPVKVTSPATLTPIKSEPKIAPKSESLSPRRSGLTN